MSLLGNVLKSALARVRRGRDVPAAAPADPPAAGATRETSLAAPLAAALKAGLERLQAGDLVEAERRLAAVVEEAPDAPEALVYLGVALARQQRHEEAFDCFTLATHHRSDYAEAHFQLALADLHLGRSDAALAGFRRVVELTPDYADAHSNIGFILYKHLESLDEAETHLRRALELRPSSIDARTNLAMVLDHKGETKAALAMYERVLEAAPETHEARLNRGLIRLAHGDYARGWPDYEARRFVQRQRAFPYPEWKGAPLAGRTVLVHAEQGLGDEIMFASCVDEVIAQAGHCVIDCHPKLERLFRRSFPAATVHGALQTDDLAWLASMPVIDCRIGIGSLPLRFRPSPAAFPRHAGYLKADPARVAHWRARLEALGQGLKVGISWRGGTTQTRWRARSIPLEQWRPLLAQPGARFVSLQYTDCREEVAAFEKASGLRLPQWPEAIDDYDETAALTCALDLVVSVQTSLVHLAGALGRPVWVLVPVVPEWRYLVAGDSLPWYPSVRVWRQEHPNEWQPVVARVVDALRAFDPRR